MSSPCRGLDGVAILRPKRPRLALAGRHSLDAGGSVQSFLEGITTVQRNAFGQGAKFGTDPLSTPISPRVRLFARAGVNVDGCRRVESGVKKRYESCFRPLHLFLVTEKKKKI